jgi:acetolactate synthase-1/2/3 large subunit
LKLSDYLFQYLAKYVQHVFFVPGGGSMHLCDSMGYTEGITPINCMHEQAASFAAEAYAQFKGLGVCLVTSGPGGTNAITGCASAWCNSMPVLFISGQVNTYQLKTPEQRFNGVQELDIISMVKPITKKAMILDMPNKICDKEFVRVVLSELIEDAQRSRQGPVWLDIPLDVQSMEI